MNLITNPYYDTSTKNFYKRWKKNIDNLKDSLSGLLDSKFQALLILPPKKDYIDKNDADEKLTKFDKRCQICIILSDLKGRNIEAKENKITEKIIQLFVKNNIDKNLVRYMFVNELWQECLDKNYFFILRVSHCFILYDNNLHLISTFITSIHLKNYVIGKFSKYVLCFCFAGSAVKGTYRSGSDLDLFIVIDDTDVKSMSLSEIDDRLRKKILTKSIEISKKFCIEYKLNIQIYLLTYYWECLRDCNPIIYTLLRDGIPLYDKDVFTVWKLLLERGFFKPSDESIEKHIDLAKRSWNNILPLVREITIDNLYYTLLNNAQAALMLKGIPPTTPQETPAIFFSMFKDPPYEFPSSDYKTLMEIISLRKKIGHGKQKFISFDSFIKLYKKINQAKFSFIKLNKTLIKEKNNKK